MALKKLGTVEIDTKRMFVSRDVAICETVSGDYVFLNGQPVTDKALLDHIPQEHRGKAIEWYERTFEKAKEIEVKPVPVEEVIPEETQLIKEAPITEEESIKKIRDKTDKTLEKILGKKR